LKKEDIGQKLLPSDEERWIHSAGMETEGLKAQAIGTPRTLNKKEN